MHADTHAAVGLQLIRVDRARKTIWPIPIHDGDRELALAGQGPGGGPRANSTHSQGVQQTTTLTY
jgi:hypothetical protein